jgi:hypothetical protein
MSIDNGPTRTLDVSLDRALSGGKHSMVLRPDPPPSQRYRVAITVDALAVDGALLAIGSAAADVRASGCNRLDVWLTALPVSDGGVSPPDVGRTPAADGAPSPDAAPVDMPSLPPASRTCIANGTPDEDGDGRPDSCDACPADYDPQPVDTDGDGLPDACDPDPMGPINNLRYFEPFNVDRNHWSGGFAYQGGALVIAAPAGGALSSNATDTFPANIRVQTFVTLSSPSGAGTSTAGLFLGDQSASDGLVCAISSTDGLGLYTVFSGSIMLAGAQPLSFSTGSTYRLRLSQEGNDIDCEGFAGNVSVVIHAQLTPTPLPAPLHAALRVSNMEAHFNSVVAETTSP